MGPGGMGALPPEFTTYDVQCLSSQHMMFNEIPPDPDISCGSSRPKKPENVGFITCRPYSTMLASYRDYRAIQLLMLPC